MAVIVPSRGRPGNIVRLMEQWQLTGAEARLHVMIDEDDPEVGNYLEALQPNVNWMDTWIGPRRRLGGSLNHVAPILVNDYDVVGFMGDDHRPRSVDWDVAIGRAMVPGGVVYGNDLIQGAVLPTAVFMDSRIVRTLGYFVPPGAVHLFLDNYWKLIGEQLGTLRYLSDVVIEHVHPIAGKAEWDDGYREVNAGDVWEHDEQVFKEWVAFQMPDAIAAIRAAL